MKANVCVYSTDWKEHVPASKLLQMIQFVQSSCGGEAQVSDDVARGGDDSINTVVWPAGIEFELIDEDTCWCLTMAELIHVTNEGKLFFMFDTVVCGGKEFPGNKWLDMEKALIWLNGMESFEMLNISQNRRSCTKEELAEFQKNVNAALEMPK